MSERPAPPAGEREEVARMEVRRDVRAPWVKPVLVQKPLEETRAGKGSNWDGFGDKQS